MLIDAKETLALAEMLRISISNEDALRLAGDMSSVLDYVRKLDELDVSGVDPMGVAFGGYAPLREDVVGPTLPPDDLDAVRGVALDDLHDVLARYPLTSPLLVSIGPEPGGPLIPAV